MTRDLDALIIGAGFSGMYQLICLRDPERRQLMHEPMNLLSKQ